MKSEVIYEDEKKGLALVLLTATTETGDESASWLSVEANGESITLGVGQVRDLVQGIRSKPLALMRLVQVVGLVGGAR